MELTRSIHVPEGWCMIITKAGQPGRGDEAQETYGTRTNESRCPRATCFKSPVMVGTWTRRWDIGQSDLTYGQYLPLQILRSILRSSMSLLIGFETSAPAAP